MHPTGLLSFCLVFLLFGCSVLTTQAPVSLRVHRSSSQWWVAVQVIPDLDRGDVGANPDPFPAQDLDTSSSSSSSFQLWLKDASSDFVQMEYNANWGYYDVSSTSNSGFNPPLTIQLTAPSGEQLTAQMDTISPDAIIRIASGLPATPSNPSTPTAELSGEGEEEGEGESSAAHRPGTGAGGDAPAPPSTPSTTDLCAVTSTTEEPLQILVPLYVYPGSAWDALANAASKAHIIAIINPNSGPLSVVDSAYATYMTKLDDAGIQIVGYVHTSYGDRSLSDVQADVNTYATNYPLVRGIFFDEAANEAGKLEYYTQAYNFVMSKEGYRHVILNPGVQPDQGYLSISTNIVIFENYASSLATTSFDSWVTCAPNAAQKAGWKYRFSGIAHTASADIQANILASLADKGMGLVYVTDGAGGCCTYNELVSYFAEEASSVQALN